MSFCKSLEYVTWKELHRRCENPKHYQYILYGGRGIKVCARWSAFSAFLEDMGHCRTHGHVLTRIELTRDYEPGNCVWAPPRTNTLHKPAPVLEYRGEVKTLAEWGRRYKIAEATLRARLYNGWPTDKALRTPVKEKKNG